LASTSQLPQYGHIGDAWAIGEQTWIWTYAPGALMPGWIDP
jgi:hypothetical protein